VEEAEPGSSRANRVSESLAEEAPTQGPELDPKKDYSQAKVGLAQLLVKYKLELLMLKAQMGPQGLLAGTLWHHCQDHQGNWMRLGEMPKAEEVPALLAFCEEEALLQQENNNQDWPPPPEEGDLVMRAILEELPLPEHQ